MAELRPPPTPATREDAIANMVEALEIELRRVEARIRSVGWGAPSPRRLSMAEEWGVFAGTIEPVDHSDGDGLAHRRPVEPTDAELKAMYPNSPRLWPSASR